MAHLQPSRLAVLLKKMLPWELDTRKDGVVAKLNGTPVEFPYAAITDLDETPGWLWSTLRLRTAEGDIFLSGAAKADTRNLIQKITPRVTTAVTREVMKLQEPARRLFRHLDTFLTSPKYLAQSDLQNWLNAVQALPQPELLRLWETLRDQAAAARQRPSA